MPEGATSDPGTRPHHACMASRLQGLMPWRAGVMALLMGICCWGDDASVPVVELTYRAADRAADAVGPPAPVDAWWQDAIGESISWWSTTSGVPVDAAAAVAHLRSLHLLAGGVTGADRKLTPTIAGWLDESAPILATSLQAMVARWPGYQMQIQEQAQAKGPYLTLSGPHGILPDERDPPPGLRVTLHGRGCAEELRWRAAMSETAEPPTAQDLAFALALMADWNPSAGIDPGPHGWISTDLPATWFTPVDPLVVGHLPQGWVAWAAVALDGTRIGGDLHARLAAAGVSTAWPASLVPLIDPALVASALDGTWVAAAYGHGFLARAPRSATLDILLGLAAASHGVTLPTDEQPVEVAPELFWACSPSDWIIADSRARIATWFDGGQSQPIHVPTDALVVAAAQESITATALTALDDLLPGEHLLAEEMPLPQRARFPSPVSGRHAHAAAPAESAWPAMVQLLDRAGGHQLAGRAVAGRLVIALDGPVLPWVLPGLAIRWFADIAEDEEGKRDIREVFRHLRETGQPVTIADDIAHTLASLSPADAARLPGRIGAWTALVAASPAVVTMKTQDDTAKRMSEAVLPWTMNDLLRSVREATPALLQTTALLDEPSGVPYAMLGILTHPDTPSLNAPNEQTLSVAFCTFLSPYAARARASIIASRISSLIAP